jgi:hypothetical protein
MITYINFEQTPRNSSHFGWFIPSVKHDRDDTETVSVSARDNRPNNSDINILSEAFKL